MKAGRSAAVVSLLVVFAVLVTSCAAVTPAPASGDQSLAKLKQANTIVVGMNDSPPLNYWDLNTGEAIGVDIELVRLVAKDLGIQNVVVKQLNWEALIPGLQSGKFDVIASGMWITPARQEQITFSLPVDRFGSVVITKPGNPPGIKKWEDIKGKTVGMDLGQGDYDPAVAAGATVKTYTKGLPEIAADLTAGRIDAIVYEDLYTRVQMTQNPDIKKQLEIVAPTPNINNSGHGFRKTDTTLIDAYNKSLKKLIDDGTVLNILKKYGMDETNLPK